MSTKVKNETSAKVRGSRKSEKVSAKELQSVVKSVSVSSPSGSGLSDGVTASAASAGSVSVGSSSASSVRAKRLDARAKLENSLHFEGFKLSCGVRDLSAKLGGFFAAKEWTGEKADLVRSSLDMMFNTGAINQEQKEMMWRAAAKNAGVDLSAPCVSAGRVLAVVRREGLIPDFVSLVGMSFNNIRKHIKDHGLNDYSWRLGVGAIRSNSDINDFIDIVSVVPGSSASSVIGALLSLANFVDFNKRLSVAKSSDISDYHMYVSLVSRIGKRLGFGLDRINNDMDYEYNTCSTSDHQQRKQFRKNLATQIAKVNEYNDIILSLGGVTVLNDKDITSKVARTIKSALKNRSRAYSDINTLEKLLDM